MIFASENMEIVGEGGTEGGRAKLELKKLLPASVMPANLGLYARATLIPGAAVDYHVHTGESETYYILSGRGEYNDNGTIKPVSAGEVTFTADGEGHGLRNTGSEDLVFIALIVRN